MGQVSAVPDAPGYSRIVGGPDALGQLATHALRDEAVLTPKPGLVDLRGGGAHDDMDVTMMLASADALEQPIARCADAALALPLGRELRIVIGAIGRAGEQRMLDATWGVNTHRGSLWALGLLAAGLAATDSVKDAAGFAARLASISDPVRPAVPSRGALARRRYGATGALGEACAGFPHTMQVAWPALRAARAAGRDAHTARTDALVACMATLDDTCLLHRAGPAGLRIVRDGAAAILRAGGSSTRVGKRLLDELDRVCRRDRLSPGGSGDVLAAALFMDSVTARWPAAGEE